LPTAPVAVARIHDFPVVVRVIAVDGLREYALGQTRVLLFHELVGGDEFSPRIARHVGHQHLDFRNTVVDEPLVNGIHGRHFRLISVSTGRGGRAALFYAERRRSRRAGLKNFACRIIIRQKSN
jgi:hypothetical protein